MFGGVASAAASLTASPTHLSCAVADDVIDGDPYALADAYGHEATARLALTLRVLEAAGFAKARAPHLSAFERVLGGAAWALQQLVAREDAVAGRVQWDALFQPHAALKARLGFAQEVARCVDALPRARPAPPVQPHQLLLQDFGDIGAVHGLVQWLVGQLQGGTPHLDAVREYRGYQRVLARPAPPAPVEAKCADAQCVQRAFRPRRRWQFQHTGEPKSEETAADADEDALVQRCLLEYGERVGSAAALPAERGKGGDEAAALALGSSSSDPAALMAQLASQAAAAAAASAGGGASEAILSARRTSGRTASAKRFVDPQTADFEAQYARAREQAAAEQRALRSRQREREAQLLRQAVAAPESPPDESALRSGADDDDASKMLATARTQRQAQDATIAQLIAEKRSLEARAQEAQAQAAAVAETAAAVEQELARVAAAEAQDAAAQPLLATLRALVARNEALKQQRTALRAQCRDETAQREARVAQLQAAVAAENEAQNATTTTATTTTTGDSGDEAALRLREIEQLHAQMAGRHRELRVALAQQTRAVQRQLRRVDDVPTRVERLQYETRFRELSDEVALTLDETRKHFCTYNARKTALAFLEKEIALLDSIRANVDAAMGAKAATLAFFAQLDAFTQGVQGAADKHRALRDAHQQRVDALDRAYQLLLAKERAYVAAVRDFERECEKNERLQQRLAGE
ncbi:hypothetical protein PybrP1_013202 [[Pythium] brassicae (nom. inval.)]|nr:hypothetical protein PybrP1_013202 [[Pythium] brassicae (nom. inval.)]